MEQARRRNVRPPPAPRPAVLPAGRAHHQGYARARRAARRWPATAPATEKSIATSTPSKRSAVMPAPPALSAPASRTTTLKPCAGASCSTKLSHLAVADQSETSLHSTTSSMSTTEEAPRGGPRPTRGDPPRRPAGGRSERRHLATPAAARNRRPRREPAPPAPATSRNPPRPATRRTGRDGHPDLGGAAHGRQQRRVDVGEPVLRSRASSPFGVERQECRPETLADLLEARRTALPHPWNPWRARRSRCALDRQAIDLTTGGASGSRRPMIVPSASGCRESRMRIGTFARLAGPSVP